VRSGLALANIGLGGHERQGAGGLQPAPRPGAGASIAGSRNRDHPHSSSNSRTSSTSGDGLFLSAVSSTTSVYRNILCRREPA
jgi:hypothetical protein